MGFALEPTPEDPKVARRVKAAQRKLAKLDDLLQLAKGGCKTCPLDKARLEHPKMKPTGAAQPAIYVLGEAPGEQEDEQGEQFVGKSGRLLRDQIPAKYAHHFRWNNTIRCRPPNNRNPEPLETECCRTLQVRDIEQAQPLAIFGFGLVPLAWAAGSGSRTMTAWRGRKWPVQIGTHTCWYYCMQHPAFILRLSHYGGAEQEQTFKWDVQQALDEVLGNAVLREPHVIPKRERAAGIRFPQSTSELFRMMDEAMHWPEMGIDIETNGLRPYFNGRRILTISVSCGGDTIAFPYHHPERDWSAASRTFLKRFLLSTGKKWAHNLNFELEWLAAEFGEEILRETTWGDTLAQAYVLDEREGAKALEDLTLLHFGFDVKAESQVDTASLISEPLAKVLPYNGLDAKWCYMLRGALGQAHIEAGLPSQLYEEQVRRSPTLVAAQRAGLVPNPKAVDKLEMIWKPKYDQALAALTTDKDNLRYTKKTGKVIMRKDQVVPSAQALLAFFDHIGLKSKLSVSSREEKYSTKEEVISRLDHPVAKAVPALRNAQKMLSTYILKMRPGPNSSVRDDGLVHTQFNHCIASTRRLTSEDPNAQNYPAREYREVREIIGAPPDYSIVSFDYAQLEARVIAMASGDKVLVQQIRDGYDIHGDWRDMLAHEWPAIVGGKKMLKDKVAMKKFRDTIKNTWTFPLFFGSVLQSVASDLTEWTKVEIDPDRLEPYYNKFWDQYGGVLTWQEQTVASYMKLHYVVTLNNFRRHAPLGRNEIINTPIQSPASDIVVDGMCRLSEQAWREQIPALQPRINIHDDLTFYFPDDKLEDLIEYTAREMVSCPFEWAKTVPLAVEVKVGKNWYEQEEVAVFSSKEET